MSESQRGAGTTEGATLPVAFQCSYRQCQHPGLSALCGLRCHPQLFPLPSEIRSYHPEGFQPTCPVSPAPALPTVPPVRSSSRSGSRVIPQRRTTAPLAQERRLGVTPHAFTLSGGRDSKAPPLLTVSINAMSRPARSRLSRTNPDAASTVAITGLSYPATHPACARWCQVFQVSPQTPDASRRPQQPTCRGRVLLSRAALGRDFHPFAADRVGRVATVPVSASPSLAFGGLGRRREFHPPAPVVAAPAQLRACGFSVGRSAGWRPTDLTGVGSPGFLANF